MRNAIKLLKIGNQIKTIFCVMSCVKGKGKNQSKKIMTKQKLELDKSRLHHLM
jgi:hypothetical protein